MWSVLRCLLYRSIEGSKTGQLASRMEQPAGPPCRLRTAPARFTSCLVFYGLANWLVNDVVEWFPTQAAAERTLAEALRDEAEFELPPRSGNWRLPT